MNMSYELLGILITIVGQGLYVAYKLGQLEQKLVDLDQKQEKHNKIIERTYKAESDIEVLKEQIKVENHRIDDLEGIQHECQKGK